MPNNNEAVVTSSTLTSNNNEVIVTSKQTVEEITLVIISILKNYSIENKILALTMDNTATNKAMSFKELLMSTCLDDESLTVLKSFCQLLKLFKIATSVLLKNQSNSIFNALIVILEIG
ncbi:8877_t:CDS:2 [Cetraspora pellucida]|uniref:8877_t:CDS:1 n=1 Tax=Cetraspora pellucida TaxID=1433469 RepID=A0A9N9GYG9_9GLOM|nr:8877_t:CDS:2 [Cetraspora pellucida]